ncbi:MaoC family dehydratase N-terminal domain-containing protein [Lentzea sp. NPDC051213]|uniref:MaoC family dehydratase N-terminal domain-containing protein n=1 Tax=Lentzea sp. NPDC051213 TaxID=3364126 RepID=UPI0037ABF33E
MPLDPSFIGRSYPPSQPYDVSREKIREFADAIGATSPAYRDVEAAKALGHRDVIAPPTFAIVVSMKTNETVMFDPVLELDYSRVVHGDQNFTHHRPITAGDQLVCVAHIDAITNRMGNDMVTVRTEIATVEGEPVTTAKSMLVVRGEDA